MKTNLKYFVMALVAIVASLSFSSCSKDEDPMKGVGNYYIQFVTTQSNLVDAEGKSLVQVIDDNMLGMLKSEFKADAQGRFSIGKLDNQTAKKTFDAFMSTLSDALGEAWAGKLPKNGLIIYEFCLDSDATYAGATSKASIKVTDTGACVVY